MYIYHGPCNLIPPWLLNNKIQSDVTSKLPALSSAVYEAMEVGATMNHQELLIYLLLSEGFSVEAKQRHQPS